MNRLLFSLTIFAIVVSMGVRLLPHPPNFTPVGALALFAGIYLGGKSKWVLLLPLAIMFLTDLAIGFYDFKLMAVVYLSLLFYGVFGMLIKNNKTVGTVALATLAGSFLFYLFTNFAVWAFSPWYPADFSGLILSYTLALPFFKYTLLGDLFFVGVFVGAYELALALLKKRAPILNPIKLWKT